MILDSGLLFGPPCTYMGLHNIIPSVVQSYLVPAARTTFFDLSNRPTWK